MAQRDDQLTRTDASRLERLWGRITKVTLGYGYQPWRALLFLAAVVVTSCALAVVLGAHGALVQTGKTATPGRSCTVVQQVSVGLDLNLPVGTTVARVDCDVTSYSASVTAAWLSAVGWVLRLLAWTFAALFIAGFTSAVRKTLSTCRCSIKCQSRSLDRALGRVRAQHCPRRLRISAPPDPGAADECQLQGQEDKPEDQQAGHWTRCPVSQYRRKDLTNVELRTKISSRLLG
jgi:hypothetical protein